MSLLSTEYLTNKAQILHRQAALALLCKSTDFSHKEAGFLGHVAVAPALSPKQIYWLNCILARHGLSPIDEGGEDDELS